MIGIIVRMADPITASALRKDVYNLLDRILETGEELYILRKGKRLKIVPMSAPPRSVWDGPSRRATDLSIDELAAVSWEHLWSPDDA